MNLQLYQLTQDTRMRVEVLRGTPNPQQVAWLAAAQDYSEDNVFDRYVTADKLMAESQAGGWVVDTLCKKGHFGPLEHPQFVFNVIGFPHSSVMQFRTHRTGISFDVQSGRYSGKRFINVVLGKERLEDVFYLRPVGRYRDRSGADYEYTHVWRLSHELIVLEACRRYKDDIERGMSEEHARGLFPAEIRQNFVLSCNARTVMHLLSLRWATDAQLEAQYLAELLHQRFLELMPEVATWYAEKHKHKNWISP